MQVFEPARYQVPAGFQCPALLHFATVPSRVSNVNLRALVGE